MEATRRVRLNGREVLANVTITDLGPDTPPGVVRRRIFLGGVVLVTTYGGRKHRGVVEFRYHEDPDHVYTDADVTGASYWGMRGSGHATPSRFRYIGLD